jgi:hypothetical protein
MMQCPPCTHTYSYHGLGITVTSEARISEAIHKRLRHFLTPELDHADLCFEFYRVSNREKNLITKPRGVFRPVHDTLLGEVAYADATDQLYINFRNCIRLLCDLGQGLTRVTSLSKEADDLWLLSQYMFIFPFVELLKRHGCYNLHAAGLCLNGRGLLLPGHSGSGKSTLALLLLRAGFDFLGDDTLFLTDSDAGLRVLAFPDAIDLTDETVNLLAGWCDLKMRPKAEGWSKHQLWAEDIQGGKTVWECQPAVVVFPHVAHTDKSILKPMAKDEALVELLPNITLTEARTSQAHLDALATLLNVSTCYRLETGRDFNAIPGLLREVMA